MALALESFVSKTLGLLEKERAAEIEEASALQANVSAKELQRKGVCLLKLHIESRHTGLYGRTILVFSPSWQGKEMPAHNFTPGDIAGLSLSQGEGHQETIASGIISRVSQSAISVAFDESHDTLSLDDSLQYKLNKLANDITYKRLKKALGELNTYRSGPSGQLISVLFGLSEVGPPFGSARDGKDFKETEIQFFNERLDQSQMEAVTFAMAQRELAVIHGPPGTGKTTTVVEIIRQAVSRKLKVLACAPSNIAVDNLVERLGVHKTKVVRLGHPARLLHNIHKYSLDAILATSEETKLVEDVRKDMDKALSQMRKTRDKGERQKLRDDMKHLRKELRERENTATRDILKRAEVVLATLTTASGEGPLKHLGHEHFDLVVIDECSQALEAACWIALLQGPKCILAGDHHQLPPTILSHEAAKEGLEVTLMERLLGCHGDKVMRMLTMQYRMNEAIMKWSSDQLYEGKLVAHHSVSTHLLKDLPGVQDNEDTCTALLLVDTTGCDLPELNVPEEVSKGNEGEADLVAVHVGRLVDSGLSQEDIAVIAPYNLQVELLRLRLSQKYPRLEIKSVDGFQGREKEAVIISLVRSNEKGEVGFLAEDRRINVAITRARRHLALFCDSETVSHHDFLKSLVDYMNTNGEVRSAQQYVQEGALEGSTLQRPDGLDSKLSASRVGTRPKTTKKKKKQATDEKDYKQDFQTKRKENMEIHNEQRDADRKLQLKQTLEDFQKSHHQDECVLSSLNSYERRLVHEIAEELGLIHISKGEGADRHMVIRKEAVVTMETSQQKEHLKFDHKESLQKQNKLQKKNKGSDNPYDAPEEESENVARSDEELVRERDEGCDITADVGHTGATDQSTENSCPKCGKVVPKQNFELHTLRCDKTENRSSQRASKSSSAKKKKNKGNTKEKAADTEEDFDRVIAEAMKFNTTCFVGKCKENAAILGQNCPFCANRFCLTHFMPEVHGCGAQAKIHARQMISREGVIYRGSGVPSKKPNPEKRAHLQKKLEKKLHGMADNRKVKKKEKE